MKKNIILFSLCALISLPVQAGWFDTLARIGAYARFFWATVTNQSTRLDDRQLEKILTSMPKPVDSKVTPAIQSASSDADDLVLQRILKESKGAAQLLYPGETHVKMLPSLAAISQRYVCQQNIFNPLDGGTCGMHSAKNGMLASLILRDGKSLRDPRLEQRRIVDELFLNQSSPWKRCIIDFRDQKVYKSAILSYFKIKPLGSCPVRPAGVLVLPADKLRPLYLGILTTVSHRLAQELIGSRTGKKTITFIQLADLVHAVIDDKTIQAAESFTPEQIKEQLHAYLWDYVQPCNDLSLDRSNSAQRDALYTAYNQGTPNPLGKDGQWLNEDEIKLIMKQGRTSGILSGISKEEIGMTILESVDDPVIADKISKAAGRLAQAKDAHGLYLHIFNLSSSRRNANSDYGTRGHYFNVVVEQRGPNRTYHVMDSLNYNRLDDPSVANLVHKLEAPLPH